MRNKKYYENLDFLRAIAVLMTIWAHYSPFEIPYLWCGVSIFFSISGFLITEILLEKKETKIKVSEILKTFYIRRSLRLFPLYYSFILFFWFLLHFANLHIWQDRFNYYFIFYAPNFLISQISLGGAMGFAHLWSLGVEEQFYLFWPVILLLTPRRWMVVTITFFICVGLFFRTVQFDVDFDTYLLPFSHFHTLCGGALIAVFKMYYPKFFSVLARWRSRLLGIASILLLLALIFKDFGLMTSAFFQSTSLALFTSLLVLYHLFSFPRSMTQNSFYQALLYIGKISYGLYIIHMPIPYVVRAVFLKVQPAYQVNQYLVVLLSLIITFVFAALSFKYFESYFIRLKEKFE